MDNEKSYENLDKIVDRYKGEFSKGDTMDFESVNLSSELNQIEQNVNYYKWRLQNCRDQYENVEMKICDVRQSQEEALFALNKARMKEEDLQERLEDINLSYQVCVEKSGGIQDPDERIRATISELTTRRNTLMQELVGLRKITENNNRKLARVNVMITEQEEKNRILLQELMGKSKKAESISPDKQKRIDALLKHLKRDERHDATPPAMRGNTDLYN